MKGAHCASTITRYLENLWYNPPGVWSVQLMFTQNKWISIWLMVLLSLYCSGCSGLNAEYEVEAETENTGWVRSYIKTNKKIYRFNVDKVSLVICGYKNTVKTILVGGPFIPFIPPFHDHSGKNLAVEFVV
jgi:hypothetical protein